MKNKDVNSLEHTSWRCQYHIVITLSINICFLNNEIISSISIKDDFSASIDASDPFGTNLPELTDYQWSTLS